MAELRLPPLNALRAFEAAARRGNFAAAAADLHVTHWAIGKQIKLLEDWFGVALFERRPRGVALTNEGAELLGDTGEAFSRLAAATEKVAPPGDRAPRFRDGSRQRSDQFRAPLADPAPRRLPGILPQYRGADFGDIAPAALCRQRRRSGRPPQLGTGAWLPRANPDEGLAASGMQPRSVAQPAGALGRGFAAACAAAFGDDPHRLAAMADWSAASHPDLVPARS